MKFDVEKLDEGLRFTNLEGWVDLRVLGDGRALIDVGTYNDTNPASFGGTLWQLLSTTMPDLELTVVSAEFLSSQHLEMIYVGAGFTKDGVRRAWLDGRDAVVYSILTSEVQFEVKEPEKAEVICGAIPAD